MMVVRGGWRRVATEEVSTCEVHAKAEEHRKVLGGAAARLHLQMLKQRTVGFAAAGSRSNQQTCGAHALGDSCTNESDDDPGDMHRLTEEDIKSDEELQAVYEYLCKIQNKKCDHAEMTRWLKMVKGCVGMQYYYRNGEFRLLLPPSLNICNFILYGFRDTTLTNNIYKNMLF
uniref:Uncharacterized protein n=2 Tax=Leersia perrieri TaxID=77586 RepID=A0A0D9VW94_9ORYZ